MPKTQKTETNKVKSNQVK